MIREEERIVRDICGILRAAAERSERFEPGAVPLTNAVWRGRT